MHNVIQSRERKVDMNAESGSIEYIGWIATEWNKTRNSSEKKLINPAKTLSHN